MEGLSIEQLADLKIAIKKNDIILKENEAKNTELEKRNDHLVGANKRLDDELNLQADRIDTAKEDNEKLRLDKEGILSKFAEDNEKNYKELREKETKIANDNQQNALRLIEIEKRESKLVNKENTNTVLVNEAKAIQKEAKAETIRGEEKLIQIEANSKKLKLQGTKIEERTVALKEIEKELNTKKIEIQEKELTILGSIQTNQNLVAELNLKEKTGAIQIERLEKLNALFSELKGYVTEKADVTIADIEKFVGLLINLEENGEEDKVETDDVSTEILDPQPKIEVNGALDENNGQGEEVLTEPKTEDNEQDDENNGTLEEEGFKPLKASYPELLTEAKTRGLKFDKNPKKEVLIDLLLK